MELKKKESEIEEKRENDKQSAWKELDVRESGSGGGAVEIKKFTFRTWDSSVARMLCKLRYDTRTMHNNNRGSIYRIGSLQKYL